MQSYTPVWDAVDTKTFVMYYDASRNWFSAISDLYNRSYYNPCVERFVFIRNPIEQRH
jgi:hypothetical protein